MSEQIEVLGIGNAIVDVLGYCSDNDIDNRGLQKGSMSLINESQAEELYEQLDVTVQHSGGSAANSIAALAQLGVKCGFIGKIRGDKLGDIFSHDLKALGVEFTTKPATGGSPTALCLVHVTPDAERTMATHLGACVTLAPSDIDHEQIKRSKITYVEGYLWDSPAAIEAISKALLTAKVAGNKTAFTLSDTFCVARHRAAFQKLASEVDILFANEDEVMALYESNSFEEAINELSKVCKTAAVTRSEKGCIILTKEERIEVPTEQVEKLVDTTGAGDLFAAGFLYGLSQDWSLGDSAKLGNKAAGRIIQQLGARSLGPLRDLIEGTKAA